MKKFCPKCGKTISEGIFCEDCNPKKLDYKVPLIQVSEFNRTWNKCYWQQFGDLEDLIRSRVKGALNKDVEIIVEPFEFHFRKKEKIDLVCRAKIDGKEIPLKAKLAYRQCDMGQKERSQYFEGILQLRGTNEGALDFIQKELKLVARKGIFVSKQVELKDGLDLYLTNKNYIKLLAQKLHSKFGAKVSVASQLFSRNHLTSKDIYRINVLVTFHNFELKDIIFFTYAGSKRTKPKEYFVFVNKLGKLITGIDITNGKTVSFESKYLHDAEIIKPLVTKVSSTKPQIKVLHPETYQEEMVVNSLVKDLETDDEVFVVLTNIGTFIVGFANCEDL